MIRNKLFVFFLPILFLLMGANFALGLETLPNAPETLQDFIKYIYNLSLAIGGLLTFAVLVYGGFRYLTSIGKPAIMADAKDQIVSAISGLIILLSSYLILYTIDPQMVFIHPPVLEEVVMPEIEPPEPGEEKLPVYFQIPTGMIIENAALNEQAQAKLDYAYQTAKETAQTAGELYERSKAIYDLAMGAVCGTSICDANCLPTGCAGIDNQTEINKEITKTSPVIRNLNEKINKLTMATSPLANDFSQLEAAGYLKSLGSGAIDYNTLLGIRHHQEIEIATFPGWEDIDIRINGQTVKDPVTFYLNKERNEDVIRFAESIYQDTYDTVPEAPPGGWPAPPAPAAILRWPVNEEAIRITSYFGPRDNPMTPEVDIHFHYGIDFGPRHGVQEPILAAAEGRVILVQTASTGYGNRIMIEHETLGLITLYAHLASFNIEEGKPVTKGQKIGIMGTTGNSNGVHLHFGVRDSANPEHKLDPAKYLPRI